MFNFEEKEINDLALLREEIHNSSSTNHGIYYHCCKSTNSTQIRLISVVLTVLW